MTLYLDASVVVPLFITDPLSQRAEALMRRTLPIAAVSDFCAAEFASAVATRVRAGSLSSRLAQVAFSEFDSWVAQRAEKVELASADLLTAAGFMRRLDLPLKTGDTIHLAIAQRTSAVLATFDRQMAASAEALGLGVRGE